MNHSSGQHWDPDRGTLNAIKEGTREDEGLGRGAGVFLETEVSR